MVASRHNSEAERAAQRYRDREKAVLDRIIEAIPCELHGELDTERPDDQTAAPLGKRSLALAPIICLDPANPANHERLSTESPAGGAVRDEEAATDVVRVRTGEGIWRRRIRAAEVDSNRRQCLGAYSYAERRPDTQTERVNGCAEPGIPLSKLDDVNEDSPVACLVIVGLVVNVVDLSSDEVLEWMLGKMKRLCTHPVDRYRDPLAPRFWRGVILSRTGRCECEKDEY